MPTTGAVLVHVNIGGKQYPLSFGHNAIRRLERQTGYAMPQILAEMRSGSHAIMHEALWAGLEGGRMKTNHRPLAYSLDEVGDMLDEHAGNGVWNEPDHEISKALIEAWTSAFPAPRKEDKPSGNGEAAPPAAPGDVAAP